MIIPDLSFWQDDPTTPQGVDFGVMAQRTQGVIIRAGQNLMKNAMLFFRNFIIGSNSIFKYEA